MQPTPAPKPSSAYFPALTGLRAVAAYLVFWHHANPFANQPASFAYHLVQQGYIGVSLFFVLSGFLIYHRYADRAQRANGQFWRVYLQNRFARIYPLYAILLTLTFGADWLRHQPPNGWTLIANYTLLKGFFESLKFSGIGQSWSLTVEECFYGLAPLLFIATRRVGIWPLALSFLLTGLGLWAVIGQHTIGGFMGSIPFVLFYTFFGRAFEFLVGIWLARRWAADRLPTRRNATLVGLLVITVCIFSQAIIQQQVNNAVLLPGSEFLTYNLILPVGVVILFQGLLTEKTGLMRWLSSPVAQALGVSSYAFYLIHNGLFNKLLTTVSGPIPGVLLLLLIGISYILYRFIEQPLQHYLRATQV